MNTSPIPRLAWRLAWSPDPRQRWRQISVLVTSLLAAFLIVISAGVVVAAHHADIVRDRRQPAFARHAASAPLLGMPDGIIIDGEQVPILWLEKRPGQGSAARLAPPGLASLPAPGSLVVSPALAARGLDAARLGMLPSQVGTGPGGTIGAEGLASASELLAYAIPRAGSSLSASAVAMPLSGYDPDAPAEERLAIEASPFMISGRAAAFLSGWLVLLPALLALIAVARSYSELRGARMHFLHRQGVSPRQLRLLAAIETSSLTLPAVIPGALAGALVAPRLGRIPGTDTTLWVGSATVPWPVIVLTGLGIVAVTALASSAGVLRPPRTRPRRLPRARRLVPLGLGLALMFGSVLLPRGSESRTLTLMAGLVFATVGVPLSITIFSTWMGQRLGRSARTLPWLVGRRLEARATTLARPACAAAALIFIAGCAMAMYSSSDDRPQVPPNAPGAYVAMWIGPDSDAVRTARTMHPDWTVLPMGEQGVQAIGCRPLAPGCRDGNLAREIVQGLQDREVNVVSRPIAGAQTTGALVLTPAQVADADLIRALGAPTRITIDRWVDPGTSRGVTAAWVAVSGCVAAAVFVLLILREAGERTLMAAAHDRPLRRLHLDSRSLEQLRWASLTLPLLISLPVGMVCALAFSFFGLGSGVTVFDIVKVFWVCSACTLAAVIVITAAIFLARVVDERVAMFR